MKIRPIFALAFLGILALPVRVHAAEDPCRANDDVAGVVGSLPSVAPMLHASATLRVLAVGSATMFGPDATLMPGTLTSQSFSPTQGPTVPLARTLGSAASDAAFPSQMANALRAAVPGLKVEVVLRGGRGLSALEMLELMRTELARGTFQLVLWQTGTVEAVRNAPPGEFAEILSDGAEAVAGAGANLVLIDPQYSRFLQTNSNIDPYSQALQQTASMTGVVLFHRYDLMRAWVNDGQIDLERTARPDRRKTVELLHRCLGIHLAHMILAGARS